MFYYIATRSASASCFHKQQKSLHDIVWLSKDFWGIWSSGTLGLYILCKKLDFYLYELDIYLDYAGYKYMQAKNPSYLFDSSFFIRKIKKIKCATLGQFSTFSSSSISKVLYENGFWYREGFINCKPVASWVVQLWKTTQKVYLENCPNYPMNSDFKKSGDTPKKP